MAPHNEGGTEAEGVENRVLRQIFEPKRGSREDYIAKTFIICNPQQTKFA
jgi:hypothetical protein